MVYLQPGNRFEGSYTQHDATPSVDISKEVSEAREIEKGLYEPSESGEAPDIEELQGDEPFERGYVEACREGESFEEHDKSKGSSSSVLDIDVAAKRDLGEKALRSEAKSKGHLLTHVPKNPCCNTCAKAKMQKPPSYAKGGSTKVDADVFGDHIIGDFFVTMIDDEEGIDSEKVALVIKDVATGFQYVYPSARRNTESIVLALKHFISPGDKIGIFYSDNAPEILSAMEVLQWRHVFSKDYISKSNAVAERLVRSILEGTRVNLLQSTSVLAPCSKALEFHVQRHSSRRRKHPVQIAFWGRLQGPKDTFWLPSRLLDWTQEETQARSQI